MRTFSGFVPHSEVQTNVAGECCTATHKHAGFRMLDMFLPSIMFMKAAVAWPAGRDRLAQFDAGRHLLNSPHLDLSSPQRVDCSPQNHVTTTDHNVSKQGSTLL